jgi:hypothetical protein
MTSMGFNIDAGNKDRIIKAFGLPLLVVLVLTVLSCIPFVGCCSLAFAAIKLLVIGWGGYQVAKLGGKPEEGAIGGATVGLIDGVVGFVLAMIVTVVFSTSSMMLSNDVSYGIAQGTVGLGTTICFGVIGIGIGVVLDAVAGFVGAILASKK